MTNSSLLDTLSVNSIRILSAEAIQKANSGHPGLPMGAASMAYVLWTKFLKHNPTDPQWPDRDRFILSAGHGSMLLYSLLYLSGYDLTIEDIRNFRQWGSRTPGHPEYRHTPGVEITTGPLGQGFATGVGMAAAERFLASKFNKPDFNIVDHYTYGIVSDGDLMEGISQEAANLAGNLKLGKLIYLYDNNHISIEGRTEIASIEKLRPRFEACGWHVAEVEDGNDLQAIEKAIQEARDETSRPSIIAVRTLIGYGSPNKQDKASAHGEPLGEEELKLTKKNLGWEEEPFLIPDAVLEHFRKALHKGRDSQIHWQRLISEYRRQYPESAELWREWIQERLPEGWENSMPVFKADEKGIATPSASGKIINALSPILKNLIGGSADLAPSNKTLIIGEEDFKSPEYKGRNIRYGIREHGMGAFMNGIALHGGLIPFGGTFFVFSDYMRPAIRLASLQKIRVIYVFTHDSIALGEDGPTHQPIEHLASLRAMPGLNLIRPCDANETVEAWKIAIESKGPTALVLTRQDIPVLDRSVFPAASNIAKGAYVLKDAEGTPDCILIGTGSEVHIAIKAAELIESKGVKVRIVNMASWRLFEQQAEEYRKGVLPPSVICRIAVEAGSSFGWERYTGAGGGFVCRDGFGVSAPPEVLYKNFGITPEAVAKTAMNLLSKNKKYTY